MKYVILLTKPLINTVNKNIKRKWLKIDETNISKNLTCNFVTSSQMYSHVNISDQCEHFVCDKLRASHPRTIYTHRWVKPTSKVISNYLLPTEDKYFNVFLSEKSQLISKYQYPLVIRSM